MSDLVKRYRDLQISIGGCHDGYCVIKKPQGMHTNGGCNCLEDMKLHERSRVGGLLKYGQEMADRIEELEAKLTKAVRCLDEAMYFIDLDEEDILKGAGVYRIAKAYAELGAVIPAEWDAAIKHVAELKGETND